MLSGRHIHRPKNIIRSSVRCFHTINICLPTRIVNFRKTTVPPVFELTSYFKSLGSYAVSLIVPSVSVSAADFTSALNFYLRQPFLPDLSDAKHLSLHWHYPHTAPRLQTKHCPAYKDSVSGQSFHLAAENKVTGIQHIQHRKTGRSHLLHIASRLRNSLEHAIHLSADMLLYHS